MSNPQGIVSSILGGTCHVACDGQVIPCQTRGKLKGGERRELHPIAVGDEVVVELGAEGTGSITEALPRRTKLSRPAKNYGDVEQVIVANADQLVIVASIRKPRPKPGLIDRYMIAAENGLLAAMLVLNKTDLAKRSTKHEELKAIYESAGYSVLLTSAATGQGLDELREVLRGKFSVIAGQSGVGKSSLINALEPALDLKVGRVSKATEKGKHTTARVTRHPLSFGGWVADTPGVREFALWDVLPEEIDGCFPEFVEPVEGCKFPGCSHRHEPGCAVLAAVEQGRIAKTRYDSYVRIREHLEQHRTYGKRTL